MHGSKKFIVARGRPVWDRYTAADIFSVWHHNEAEAARGRKRWKRSRHRTRADQYTVVEHKMRWVCGAPDYGGRLTAPAYFRRQYEKKFRARVRQLIHHERYDDLSNFPRDASWDYY